MTQRSSIVELWHAASSSEAPGEIEATCHEWLAASEKERANQFKVSTSRNQHIVGRGMARRLLSDSQISPGAIDFDLLPHGKPVVAAPEQARRPFNVAHTDGLVMCGISRQADIQLGVDVERFGRRTDPELAQRFFSRPEVALLDNCKNEEHRRDLFLKIWTLKESFIKAIGTGMHTPLADFAFHDVESSSPTIELLSPKLDRGTRWTFFSLQPRPGFIAAAAVGSDDAETTYDLAVESFDELLQG